jgi:uncharacterized protein YdaU (DUF1376 family)
MHYYQFNIGDYSSHTLQLDPIEDIAYRRMIDWCYLHEKPLPIDPSEVAREVRMREYPDAVSYVLNKYFSLSEKGFSQKRIESEIRSYKKLSGKRKDAANKRWSSKHKGLNPDASALQVQSTSNAKQEPRTINQEPLTTNHKPITKNQLNYSCWPQLPSDQTLSDWLDMRKRLKANVSQTVINRYSVELAKAVSIGYTVDFCLQECVTRNWRGFECQWLLNGVSNANIKSIVGQRDTRDRAQRAADEAFGGSETGFLEGSFTRADSYGLIE